MSSLWKMDSQDNSDWKSQTGGTLEHGCFSPELANEVLHLDSARSPDILATVFWMMSSCDAFN